jgi:hypothetical protein
MPQAVVPVGTVHFVRSAGPQKPAHAPDPAHAGRPWRGAPETPVHVPSLVAWSHASHWPAHAVSQHRPSTQWVLAHWVDAPHGVPDPSFGTQTPPEQNWDVVQLPSTLQPFAQRRLTVSQAFGTQSWSCSGPQEPLLWHEPARVATPPVHFAGRQIVLAPL